VTLDGGLREVAVGVDPMLRLADVRVLDEAQSLVKVANRYVFLAIVLVTASVILLSSAGSTRSCRSRSLVAAGRSAFARR
jgi:hypothetical protein